MKAFKVQKFKLKIVKYENLPKSFYSSIKASLDAFVFEKIASKLIVWIKLRDTEKFELEIFQLSPFCHFN